MRNEEQRWPISQILITIEDRISSMAICAMYGDRWWSSSGVTEDRNKWMGGGIAAILLAALALRRGRGSQPNMWINRAWPVTVAVVLPATESRN